VRSQDCWPRRKVKPRIRLSGQNQVKLALADVVTAT
jgi:hypothetical protein